MRKLLAGDVGATKTILGLYSADKGPQEPLAEATFSSAKYPSDNGTSGPTSPHAFPRFT